jgi:hypothetical protein
MANQYRNVFNAKLIEFVNELSRLYPEDKHLKKAKVGIRLANTFDDSLLVTHFKEHVLPHKDKILKRDIQGIIEIAHEKVNEIGVDNIERANIKADAISEIFAETEERLREMSDASKDATWNYLKILILLSEKC